MRITKDDNGIEWFKQRYPDQYVGKYLRGHYVILIAEIYNGVPVYELRITIAGKRVVLARYGSVAPLMRIAEIHSVTNP